MQTQHVLTPNLDIACETHGPSTGDPIILLHGFPYSPRAYDDIAPTLTAKGYRVIVPYLRGYGPTRFTPPTPCALASRPPSPRICWT